MTQEEYRAAKRLKEPETPQAPDLGAQPETPPAEELSMGYEEHLQSSEKNQQPEGDLSPEIPQEKTPEQRAQEDAAEYRRKYQESEGKVGLLQQQMNFTQQQLFDLQQRNKPQPQVPQQEEIPEFEDPKDTIRWIQADNAKQRKADLDALEQRFEQKSLKAEREQAAGRIINSYVDMGNPASVLHQQFTQDCCQRGIDPQTADPFTLESVAAIAAQKCGVLPQNIQQNPQVGQPLQQTRPAIPGIQRPAGPKPVDSLPQLSQRQLNWSKQLGRDPKKVQQFMKTNEAKYVRSDGTPLYGKGNQS